MMSLGEAPLIAASLPCPCLQPSNDPLRGSIAMVDLPQVSRFAIAPLGLRIG